MPAFKIIRPLYRRFGVEWEDVVTIDMPTASEAIAVAKAAGVIAPIIDDFRTPEQRERDRIGELVALRERYAGAN